MNEVALITGATRGLGLEVGRQLGREGYRVVLTGRSADGLAAAARELRKQSAQVAELLLDVDTPDAGTVAARWLEQHSLTLSVLVANAAIALQGFNGEVAKRTLETNFFGTVRVVDALVPRMAKGGRIVMVSSGLGDVHTLAPALASRVHTPTLSRAELNTIATEFIAAAETGKVERLGFPTSAYGFSKVALNAYTRILAREHPEFRVNAVCPGWVRTGMGGSDATRSVEDGAKGIVWAARLQATDPTGCFFRDGRQIDW